jgi:histidyl-tRNA synthetase
MAEHVDELCEDCVRRMDLNPLRAFDCKQEGCKAVMDGAPRIVDYLCDDCKDHFEAVKNGLDALGIAYTVDPGIVRGLDYYNRTVFEFLSGEIGAQSAVLAGGRYDGLAEELGGAPLAGLGFAMGLERLLLLMENTGNAFPAPAGPDLYIAALGDAAKTFAAKTANDLRANGKTVLTDLCERSLKAQMKYAGKMGCKQVLIVGDDELAKGEMTLKNMETGEQITVTPDTLGKEI